MNTKTIKDITGYASLAFNQAGQPFVAYEDYFNGYKATVIYYDAPDGIIELQSSQITVYPNPATGEITIETSASLTQTQLSIMNVNGQQLITLIVTGPKTQIDISRLPGGVYFVRITNDKMLEFEKFIKR